MKYKFNYNGDRIMMLIDGCEMLHNIVGWKKKKDRKIHVAKDLEGFSWDGWIDVYEKDRLICSSLQPCLLDYVVTHILDCDTCTEIYKDKIESLKKLKEEIDKEWESIIINKYKITYEDDNES
jgi:hypothetical protein